MAELHGPGKTPMTLRSHRGPRLVEVGVVRKVAAAAAMGRVRDLHMVRPGPVVGDVLDGVAEEHLMPH